MIPDPQGRTEIAESKIDCFFCKFKTTVVTASMTADQKA